MKPRIKIKTPTRLLGPGMPDDAQPGDLIVGNRGAAARVVQPASQFGGLCGCLALEYAGNYYEGARPETDRKMYDFSRRDLMRLLFLLLLIPAAAFAAEPPSKPWTALFIYSDGRISMTEDIKHEHTCREIVCQRRDGMSCDAKADADKAAVEKAKKDAAEFETKVSEYRLTHVCKIVTEIGSDDKKTPRLHCPMPNGTERIYNQDGAIISYGNFSLSGSGVVYSGPLLTKAICFQ